MSVRTVSRASLCTLMDEFGKPGALAWGHREIGVSGTDPRSVSPGQESNGEGAVAAGGDERDGRPPQGAHPRVAATRAGRARAPTTGPGAALWTGGDPWSARLKALVPLWLPWARKRLSLKPAPCWAKARCVCRKRSTACGPSCRFPCAGLIRTTLQRLEASGGADPAKLRELRALARTLDPFDLARRVDVGLDRVYRLGNFRRSLQTRPLAARPPATDRPPDTPPRSKPSPVTVVMARRCAAR